MKNEGRTERIVVMMTPEERAYLDGLCEAYRLLTGERATLSLAIRRGIRLFADEIIDRICADAEASGFEVETIERVKTAFVEGDKSIAEFVREAYGRPKFIAEEVSK